MWIKERSTKPELSGGSSWAVLAFSRSVPLACWLAASWADWLWGWTMWKRDTRLTASSRLQTHRHPQQSAQQKSSMVCCNCTGWQIVNHDSQLPLQHVHYQPINPAGVHQVPGHAPEVSGGPEQMVFTLLLQVFICGCVDLGMKHRCKIFRHIL